MSEIKKEPVKVAGSTVPFFTYQIEDTQYYEFDTSKCGPPEPMVMQWLVLKWIRLVPN